MENRDKLLSEYDIEVVCESPFELEAVEKITLSRNVIGTASGTIAETFVHLLTKEQDLEFILIRQKDYIRNLINRRRLIEAHYCLSMLSEFWIANNYEYKVDELANLIRSS